MDFGKEEILSTVDKAGELGIELFVLDDGRFGERDDDTTSLGDWYPDLYRLLGRITGLAGKIRDMGMKFGLWFKPETVSRDSCFYRAHPDWMLGSTNQPVCTGRYQYMLDFPKDQVVEYIGDRMGEILGDGGVFYVRWDMNRSISDLFSAGRGARHQGIVCYRQILGVHELYERLTKDFPHVLFESYANGNVRFGPDILYYAPQGWVSDDINGVERVKIQYRTSLVHPASSVESHIPATPNHQIRRSVPLTSRAATAFFGTSGYELSLDLLTEEEQCQVKEQIQFTEEHRKLIQQRRFYRFISPFGGSEAAWIMVSGDESKAITAYFRFLQPMNTGFKWPVSKGLSPGTMYRVSGMGYTSYGDGLMSARLILSDGASGVRINPVPQGDYLSRLFSAEAQP